MSLGFSKLMFAALVIVAAIAGRCCGKPWGFGCEANDVAGCSSCQVLCDKNDVECVECVIQDGLGEGNLNTGAPGMTNGGPKLFGSKSDFLELREHLSSPQVAWGALVGSDSYDFEDDEPEEALVEPESYDFEDEEPEEAAVDPESYDFEGDEPAEALGEPESYDFEEDEPKEALGEPESYDFEGDEPAEALVEPESYDFEDEEPEEAAVDPESYDFEGDEPADALGEPESYDFEGDEPEEPLVEPEEEYDCSPCKWDSMSSLEQRLLTQRSRSMVCDTSCLQPTGDPTYGVMMCNYFNVHKACRACCHEGHMVEGCMPCEGDGSCDTCLGSITEICKKDPCGQECQAYVCCSMQWDEYSGCMDKMFSAVAELVDSISEQCNIMFSSSSCETADVECSDSARTCSANVTVSHHL